MTLETRAALEQSIAHHERMETDKEYAWNNGEGRLGYHACALCLLHLGDDYVCPGCPVGERAGHVNCVGTPYRALETADVVWRAALSNHGLGSSEEEAAWAKRQEAERAEIAFLKSLLPEDK